LKKHAIKVLVVSRERETYDLVKDLLSLFSGIGVEWTDSPRTALGDMARGVHDAYLVSSNLQDLTGVELFRESMSTGCRVAFILLAHDREAYNEGLAAGVTDYLMIDPLDASSLERSIRYAIQRMRRSEEERRTEQEIERRVREKTAHLESFNRALQAEILIRKQAEAALHKQTRILQAILNCMGEGVAVADEGGNFIVFNQVARNLTGLGPINQHERWSEVYGCYYPDQLTLFPNDELPLARAMRGESVDDCEIVMKNSERPDGVTVSVTARPLKDERGLLGGGLVVMRDVSEQRRAQHAIESSLSQLRAAHHELESFSYSVSHDLRAPLRHIDGFVNLLKESAAPVLDQRSIRYLNIISESAVRMGEMIDSLLAFSRAGRIEMHSTHIDLERLAEEVIEELKSEYRGRNIEWQIGTLISVEADPVMLRQVLTNLLSNAIKYTRPRTTARIEIGSEPAEAGWVTFYVRDNGVGFDMKYADKLFGVFQRLHRADEFEGNGIGLAGVRRIIERHGGRAWAEGKLDEGATFFFSLPLCPPAKHESHDPTLMGDLINDRTSVLSGDAAPGTDLEKAVSAGRF